MPHPPFRLSGRKNRCVWCGKTLDNSYITADFKEGTKYAQVHEVLLCDETCRKDLFETEKKYEGKAPYFILGLVIFLSLSAISLITFMANYYMLYLGIGGTIFMGITVLRLPFVTPQTVKLAGYKKGYRMGKWAGTLLIIVGIIAGIVVFLTSLGA